VNFLFETLEIFIMKIICIADIHGNREAIKNVKEFAISRGIERFIILGDFPGYESFKDEGENLEEIKDVLNMLKNFKVLAIPGNCDHPRAVDVFNEFNVNLHEKIIVMDDLSLVGLGGSTPTPFGTPFEIGEEEIYNKLKKLIESVETDRFILALHNPPFNTECDATADGVHIGSVSIRKIVEEFQPSLVLSSHVHESGGKTDKIGNSVIANIGPLMHNRIGILDINGDIKIELMKI